MAPLRWCPCIVLAPLPRRRDISSGLSKNLIHPLRLWPPEMSNEALPQTVEHVGIYADLSVGLRLGLVSLYVVLPRLRRGVALTEKS
jgi:hypothetical protein